MLLVFLYANEVMLVITPDPTSITDAFGLVKSLITLDKNKKLVLL